MVKQNVETLVDQILESDVLSKILDKVDDAEFAIIRRYLKQALSEYTQEIFDELESKAQKYQED